MLKKIRNEKPIRRNLNFKITEEEIKHMRQNADRYAGGNLSAWLRWAAIYAVPKKSELI